MLMTSLIHRLVALNTVFITGGQFISCIVAATLSKVWYEYVATEHMLLPADCTWG